MSLKAPWKVLRQREGRDFLEVADQTGIIQIAEVGGPHRVERAAMIAAAPELYLAGKELSEASIDYTRLVQVERFARNDIAVQRAYERLRLALDTHNAALAKARGEA
jgi:hypothetical protein